MGDGERGGIFGPGGQSFGDAAGQAKPVGGDQPLQYLLGVVGEPAGEVLSGDVSGASPRGPQGEEEYRQAHLGLGMRGVGLDVVQRGTGVRGLAAGQQSFHHRLVRAAHRVAGRVSGTVGVHFTGGLRGTFSALRLVAQGSVAGDVRPQGERACLALVELGEEGEGGFSALLAGAECVAELDEFQAQHVGLEVARHGPLRDLRPLPGPWRRHGR
ncbi:hypothetical protein ACFWTC_32970 [Streptomyces sp. NPDC058619]|uniref:hypothetical protein n=1 Tax=unclassified Streptomyces TaxID=2593676 RepID=UPI00365E9EC0